MFGTNYKELIKIINKAIRNKHTYMNGKDFEGYYGIKANDRLATQLVMIGCEVENVADLFNVTLPKNTITKEQKRTLEFWDNI